MKGGAGMRTKVLAVFPSGEQQALLCNIANHSDWDLEFAQTFQEARVALRGARTAIVISECCLPDGHSWKDLLDEISTLADLPKLIVASRSAEHRLWAEVLSLGAYDLVALPFDATDMRHVLKSAWLSWKQATAPEATIQRWAETASRRGVQQLDAGPSITINSP